MNNMKPLLVDRRYEHKGVTVDVRIDFRTERITLLDTEAGHGGFAGAKKWVFAERELEYMNGWQMVFDAMKYATEQATKELKEYKEAEQKRLEEMAIAIHKEQKKLKK